MNAHRLQCSHFQHQIIRYTTESCWTQNVIDFVCIWFDPSLNTVHGIVAFWTKHSGHSYVLVLDSLRPSQFAQSSFYWELKIQTQQVIRWNWIRNRNRNRNSSSNSNLNSNLDVIYISNLRVFYVLNRTTFDEAEWTPCSNYLHSNSTSTSTSNENENENVLNSLRIF